MSTMTQAKSFAVRSCVMIDDMIEQVIVQRDCLAERLEMSKQHPEIVECQQEELRRRSAEIVDSLRALRTEILRNEMSRSDYTRLAAWLQALGQAIRRFLGFPTA